MKARKERGRNGNIEKGQREGGRRRDGDERERASGGRHPLPCQADGSNYCFATTSPKIGNIFPPLAAAPQNRSPPLANSSTPLRWPLAVAVTTEAPTGGRHKGEGGVRRRRCLISLILTVNGVTPASPSPPLHIHTQRGQLHTSRNAASTHNSRTRSCLCRCLLSCPGLSRTLGSIRSRLCDLGPGPSACSASASQAGSQACCKCPGHNKEAVPVPCSASPLLLTHSALQRKHATS